MCYLFSFVFWGHTSCAEGGEVFLTRCQELLLDSAEGPKAEPSVNPGTECGQTHLILEAKCTHLLFELSPTRPCYFDLKCETLRRDGGETYFRTLPYIISLLLYFDLFWGMGGRGLGRTWSAQDLLLVLCLGIIPGSTWGMRYCAGESNLILPHRRRQAL